MLRVGLTGGIACGKSRVAARLAAAGVPLLDLDAVAHRVLERAAYAQVVAAFGKSILDAGRRIDRKRLGARVFADPAAREVLNAITHPLIREEEARIAGALARGGGRLVVVDAALLIETGYHLRFDRLVVVHCLPREQLQRLMARDGLDRPAARARLDAQMPIREKRVYGHFDVDTSGRVAAADRAAARLALELRRLAVRKRSPIRVPFDAAARIMANARDAGPSGLTPARLLLEIARSRGVELQRLAQRLEPRAAGPWYRAARAGEPGPETLAGPLVLWALARTGNDPDFLASAAASLARLTHSRPQAVTKAVLHALYLGRELMAAVRPPQQMGPLRGLARRWGGSRPTRSGRARAISEARRLLAPAPGPLRAEDAEALRRVLSG